MYQFDKKQKIVLAALAAIVAGFICYYVYAKEDNSAQLTYENNSIIQEETKEQEEYSDDTILVHVSGAVNQEEVVELKVNSRISDAIDKVGGLREDACTEDINLAYKLEDGMKIHIPTKQEKQKEETKDGTDNYITNSSGITNNHSTNDEKSVSTKNSKVNINTATQAQLETLPGIGPSTASKILTYRKEKGKFTKIEDIKEVSGIGDAKFEKIKNYISIK